MTLPSGTVTFLFSDIEGSTRRWDLDRAAMQDAVRRHDVVMRQAIGAHGGHVFKTVGDAFCAAFSRPDQAVNAAREAQCALAAEDFSAVDGVRVRMALHAGTADERDGDYFGPAVNRVARLLATAHGGQVVLSGIVAEMTRDALPAKAQLRDLGEHRLKDLAQPEHVFQLIVADLTADYPPLLSLSVLDNNLPQQLARLIGRERDVAEIEVLVAEHRLVTLSGSGGVGKTRAALQVGANVLETFAGGVWFVDLAPLRNASFVASAVGSAVGARQSSERPVLDTVVQYLKKRRLLLIVDNCEHVLAEGARVVETVLGACLEVKVLATSREPLEVAGEQVYRLPSLAVPPREIQPNVGQALQYGAVALFADRSRLADAHFTLRDETAPIVADIVRRLDGIPLAIELAAARVKTLSISNLARRLDDRFALLTRGRRTALPRQQTLRALIDWSFDLLREDEKTLLRRAGIFAGGWTLEAAEAVCVPDVLDLLSSLVEKSLVVANFDDTATRYRLLESTRAYALEKLAEAGERAPLMRQHAAWVADFADSADEAYWRTPTQRWLAEVEPEIDNARAALEWALGAEGDAELAGRIAGGLSRLWRLAGLGAEGRRSVEAALHRVGAGCETALVARLWQELAQLSIGKAKVDAAQHTIELCERTGDRRGLADGYYYLAFGLYQVGRIDEAQRSSDRALVLYREAGMSHSLRFAGALSTRATILGHQGRTDEARTLFGQALTLQTTLDDGWGAVGSLSNLAELEFSLDDARRATQLAVEALTRTRGLRNTRGEMFLLGNLAGYQLALGDFGAAQATARDGLALARRMQEGIVISQAIQHLAALKALSGDSHRAARLLGYVDAWYASQGCERELTEQKTHQTLTNSLREQLDEAEIAVLASQGAELTEDQAADEAQAL